MPMVGTRAGKRYFLTLLVDLKSLARIADKALAHFLIDIKISRLLLLIAQALSRELEKRVLDRGRGNGKALDLDGLAVAKCQERIEDRLHSRVGNLYPEFDALRDGFLPHDLAG